MKCLWLFLALSTVGVLSAECNSANTQIPVQVTVSQNVPTPAPANNTVVAYTVPSGCQLVLEFAGVMCTSITPPRGAQLYTSGPLANSVNYRFPLNQTFLAPLFETFFANPVRAYVGPLQTVTVNVFGGGGSPDNPFSCGVSLSGYLVKSAG